MWYVMTLPLLVYLFLPLINKAKVSEADDFVKTVFAVVISGLLIASLVVGYLGRKKSTLMKISAVKAVYKPAGISDNEIPIFRIITFYKSILMTQLAMNHVAALQGLLISIFSIDPLYVWPFVVVALLANLKIYPNVDKQFLQAQDVLNSSRKAPNN